MPKPDMPKPEEVNGHDYTYNPYARASLRLVSRVRLQRHAIEHAKLVTRAIQKDHPDVDMGPILYALDRVKREIDR